MLGFTKLQQLQELIYKIDNMKQQYNTKLLL